MSAVSSERALSPATRANLQGHIQKSNRTATLKQTSVSNTSLAVPPTTGTGIEKQNRLVTFYKLSKEEQQLVYKFTQDKTQKSFQTLREGKWLNDTIILNFFSLLKSKLNTSNNTRNYFMTPFFFKNSTYGNNNNRQFDYNNVRGYCHPRKDFSYRNEIDLFEYDKVFFPCNIRSYHWVLIVVFIKDGILRCYDSFLGTHDKYVGMVQQYFAEEWKISKKDNSTWTHLEVEYCKDLPHQENGYDCGVFTCMYGYFLSMNRGFSFHQDQLAHVRKCIALSIIKDQLMIE